MQKQNLWGPESNDDATAPVECKFEDCFSPQSGTDAQETVSIGGDDYVPLEDSSQYLAGLERKLARIQGRSAGRRQAESRRLIDALASSRDTHAHELVNASNIGDDETVSAESEAAHQGAAVDPQGALGAMIRRIAPDKVALTHEELCRLLEADFLAKVQEEAAATEEEESHNRDDAHSQNDNQTTTDTSEEKKLSSDEGEK